MKIKLFFVVMLLMLVVTACGGADSAKNDKAKATTVDGELSGTKEAASATTNDVVAVDEGKYQTTDSGLKYLITEEGTGDYPQTGDLVQVHYTGSLEDGTEFDSSYPRGDPIQFPLGTGKVIPGWDEGISLLKVGGKGKLIIPPDLAYGSTGAGGVIPPDAKLYFDVELVGIAEGGPSTPTGVADADYTTTDSGLKYYDFEEGTGDSPKAGQTVEVNYSGWLEDGTKFDSSLDRGQTFKFPIGQGNVIKGWDEGVGSMKVGGKRQLVIPSDLAYGESGTGSSIPPNATLIFEVELLGIE